MRIGIIGGGGAGLSTAWLLNDHHQVTLFEKETRLGGHADTVHVDVDGTSVGIDAGFEFFSEAMFPTFVKLLKILDVPLRAFEMTVSFYPTDHSRLTYLPPMRAGKLIWRSLTPQHIINFLQLQYVLKKARRLNDNRDIQLTIQDYLASLPLTKKFKKEFLNPFLLASWCCEPEDFNDFVAYNVLRYSYKHQLSGLKPFIWTEIAGGTQTYVQALQRTLDQTTLKLGTTISSITYADNVYTVRELNGQIHIFDHLVIATNANQAATLLKDISFTEPVRSILNQVEYFQTTIAVHSDERSMPADRRAWSLVNTRYDGHHASYTIYKPWLSPRRSIFKSWVTYDTQLPEKLYATTQYLHAKVNRAYFKTQQELPAYQGQNNLWFAGLYTHDVDCHESAIMSGVNIARQIEPQSIRLKKLKIEG